MKKPLDMYKELSELKENIPAYSIEFEAKLDAIWGNFFEGLTPKELEAAQQFRWMLEGQLIAAKKSRSQKQVNPEKKLDRMLELFWQSYQNYILRLNNHDQLIVQSQDGSRSIALPIKNKKSR